MLVDRGSSTETAAAGSSRTRPAAARVGAGDHRRTAGRAPADEKAVLRDAAVVGHGFWPQAVSAVSGLDRRSSTTRSTSSSERSSSVAPLTRRWPVSASTRSTTRSSATSPTGRSRTSIARRSTARCGVDRGARPARGPRRDDRAPLPARARVRARRRPGRLGVRGTGPDALPTQPSGRSHCPRTAAERYYAAALELSPEDPAERAACFRLGKARAAGGGGVAELEEASSLLLEVGDRRGAAEADALGARLLLMQGRHGTPQIASTGPSRCSTGPRIARESGRARKRRRLPNATDRGGEAIALARQALELADGSGSGSPGVRAHDDRHGAGLMGDSAASTISRRVRGRGRHRLVRDRSRVPEPRRVLADPRRPASCCGTHGLGRRRAERFGDPTRLRWFVAERLYELYWNAAWDDALLLADELLAEIHIGAFDAHLVRGWIRLARDEVDGAAEDAEHALELVAASAAHSSSTRRSRSRSRAARDGDEAGARRASVGAAGALGAAARRTLRPSGCWTSRSCSARSAAVTSSRRPPIRTGRARAG